jgi:ubiquinone/menaquinone biosynthesis C-methylase UbiE
MAGKASRYIPALSYHWLTPFYDFLFKWGMREGFMKSRLIQRANIQPGMRILDLGCGTGTLAVMLKQQEPAADITGVDGDRQVLEIARVKAEKAGVNIHLDLGFAYDLPYPSQTFDVVLSSFMVHHLSSEDKVRAFREVRRVLKPDRRFHLLDFGRPVSFTSRVQTMILGGFEKADDNINGRIPSMLEQAGFDDVSEVEYVKTFFGPAWFYEAWNG